MHGRGATAGSWKPELVKVLTPTWPRAGMGDSREELLGAGPGPRGAASDSGQAQPLGYREKPQEERQTLGKKTI